MAQAKGKERRQIMLEEPIKKIIPKMAVPTIVAQLIIVIYSVVDTFFVSSLGTNATAAVGVNQSLAQFMTLAAQLIGMGACSYIARLLGANRKHDADEVFNTSLVTGVGIGVLLAIIGSMILGSLVDFLGATAECRQYSMDYGLYELVAAPFLIMSFILNTSLRSEGSATYAMVGMGFGGVLNCFLDPLFIFKCNLGVAGASIATAVSKFVSCVILIYPYLKKHTQVTLSLRLIRYRWVAVCEVVKIGSTSFFRSGLNVVASTVMNRIAGSFSTSALAAISVANRLMQFPFGIIVGFGQGYQPVVGFNWGAKKYERVKEAFTFSSAVSIIGGIALSAVLFIFAKPLLRLFTSADGEMFNIGVLCVRAQSLSMVVHAWVSIINMFYAGIGRATNAILLSTARSGYCYIPMLLVLPRLFGTAGLACCQAAADVLSLFVAVPLGIAAVRLIHTEMNKPEEPPVPIDD